MQDNMKVQHYWQAVHAPGEQYWHQGAVGRQGGVPGVLDEAAPLAPAAAAAVAASPGFGASVLLQAASKLPEALRP